MPHLNIAQIIGNLGRVPDFFPASDGKQPFAGLSVATTRRYRTQDGQFADETVWHNIVVYGKTAELCQRYLRKGSLVYVAGRLKTRKYTDRNGVEKSITEIIANDVQFLNSRESDGGDARALQQPSAPRNAPQASAYSGYDDSDTPF